MTITTLHLLYRILHLHLYTLYRKYVSYVTIVRLNLKIYPNRGSYSASGILTTIAVILDAFWVTLISGSPYNVVNIYLLSGAYIARTIDYIYNIYCVFT